MTNKEFTARLATLQPRSLFASSAKPECNRMTTTPADNHKAAIRILCDTIIESIQATGKLGMPSGHLYAQLMTLGMSLDQYQSIMAALLKIGVIRESGDCYHAR